MLDKDGWTLVKRMPRRAFDPAGKPDLGLVELNRLWQQDANLVACASAARRFKPTFEAFFAPMIAENFDAGSTVPDARRLVNDERWVWRANRMLISTMGFRVTDDVDEKMNSKLTNDNKAYLDHAMKVARTKHAVSGE